MKFCKIQDFCITGSGSTPSRSRLEEYYGGNIPWVKSGELKNNIVLNTDEHVTDEGYKAARLKLVPKGAILVAMYGATVGQISELGLNATTNQAVCHIIPDPELCNSSYLKSYLKSRIRELQDKRVGGGQPNISQQIIKTLQIPLPPLEEQKRIADILDKADALRQKRKQAIAKLDTLLQSIFLDMFGDPIINPKGWEVITLKELLDFKTGKLDSNAAAEDGIYHFFTCSRETYKINSFAFDCEALILSGNNASADYSVKYYSGKFNAYQRTYVLSLKNPENTYRFFRYMLEYKLKEFKRISKGSNTKYLTLGLLHPIKVIQPSYGKQLEFNSKILAIEKHKAKLAMELESLETLFNSLQQRAFKGEL